MASEMASPLEVGREGDHTANKVLFTLHFTEFTGSSGLGANSFPRIRGPCRAVRLTTLPEQQRVEFGPKERQMEQ